MICLTQITEKRPILVDRHCLVRAPDKGLSAATALSPDSSAENLTNKTPGQLLTNSWWFLFRCWRNKKRMIKMAMQVAIDDRRIITVAIPRRILKYLNHKTQLKLQTERGTFFFFILSSRDLGMQSRRILFHLSLFLLPKLSCLCFFFFIWLIVDFQVLPQFARCWSIFCLNF